MLENKKGQKQVGSIGEPQRAKANGGMLLQRLGKNKTKVWNLDIDKSMHANDDSTYTISQKWQQSFCTIILIVTPKIVTRLHSTHF